MHLITVHVPNDLPNMSQVFLVSAEGAQYALVANGDDGFYFTEADLEILKHQFPDLAIEVAVD